MGFAGGACNRRGGSPGPVANWMGERPACPETNGRVGCASGIAVAVPWPPGMRVKGGLEP